MAGLDVNLRIEPITFVICTMLTLSIADFGAIEQAVENFQSHDLVLSRQRRAFEAHQQKGLECHNKYRKDHGVPLLTMDAELNKLAKQCADYYSEKGKIDHSCKFKGKNAENLFTGIGGRWSKPNEAVVGACDSWYNEIKHYSFADGKSNGVTGHFTQLVWKKSLKVGIGFTAKGKSGFIVALYNPAGNFKGGQRENVPPKGGAGGKPGSPPPAGGAAHAPAPAPGPKGGSTAGSVSGSVSESGPGGKMTTPTSGANGKFAGSLSCINFLLASIILGAGLNLAI